MLTQRESDVLHHFGYEWWMFRATSQILRALPQHDDPVRNALIESLALHGRVLIDFFCSKPTKDPRKDDDLTVDDLGHGLCGPFLSIPEFDEWKMRANKFAAHLTSTRFSQSNWDDRPIRTRFDEYVARVKQHLHADLPDNWIGDRDANSSLICPSGPTGSAQSRGAIGATGPSGPTGT